MSKNHSLLYCCHSSPSRKNDINYDTISSDAARKFEHVLKKLYTDEDLSSNSTSTTCSLTTENLEMHTQRLSLHKCSKFERIKSFVDSITLEVIQQSDVHELHEKELNELLIYEQQQEPNKECISAWSKENDTKKKGWIRRFKNWIKQQKEVKRRSWSCSSSMADEKDKKKHEMINIIDTGVANKSADESDLDDIVYRPSLYHPRIASVPIERQPKFTPTNHKSKCHVRTSKSSKIDQKEN